jgi:hypothetical protein
MQFRHERGGYWDRQPSETPQAYYERLRGVPAAPIEPWYRHPIVTLHSSGIDWAGLFGGVLYSLCWGMLAGGATWMLIHH